MNLRFAAWFAVSASLLALLAPGVCAACSGRLHIEVQDTGVYALDYAQIVAQQPSMKDCASADLVLTDRNKEVPIRISGDRDGKFVEGSRIAWVGRALRGPQSWFDPYSTVNVYQLAAASGTHARMREIAPVTDGAAASLHRRVHFEQENLMLRFSDGEMKAGDEPDVWQWAKLTPIDPEAFAYDFDLQDPDDRATAAGGDAVLTLNFRGESNVPPAKNGDSKPVDHLVQVMLNGQLLPQLAWDGRDEIRKDVSVPRKLLKAKGNTIRLNVPKRSLKTDPQNFIIDVVMFNWMELNYPTRGHLEDGPSELAADDDRPVDVTADANATPELYSVNGDYFQLAKKTDGRYRAASAGHGVGLYATSNGSALEPALVRAVDDRDLRADTTGYDYVIVAHPRLKAAIEPLAQYHRDHGLKVGVFDVDDIYDQFNAGIAHPSAIRDLMLWSASHWQTKPRYLLLVGDASVDIRRDIRVNNSSAAAGSYAPLANLTNEQSIKGTGGFIGMSTTVYPNREAELPNRNLIPTWEFPSGSEGQSATDNFYVALKDGDFHPQLAVGRFPVVNTSEVEAIVKKTIAYMDKPAPGSWHGDVTFISTNEVAYYKKDSDKMAADLAGRGFAVQNIYTNYDGKDAAQAHLTLKNNLDQGALLVHFIGHGGQFIWRVGPPADLFTLEDVSSLKNLGRYPMVLAMTCFSAPFDNPTDDSIGERFLREPDKGAVAVFAATWKNSPNTTYSKRLIDELLKPGATIGDAVVATKASVADRSFVEMYNLLGDPAVVLAKPDADLQFMRAGDRWLPQVVVRIPGPAFGGFVDVDWLDADGQKIESHRYESRDNQFTLTVSSDKAAMVRALAFDPARGKTAFGSLRLDRPIQPIQEVKSVAAISPPKSAPAPTSATAPKVVSAPPPPRRLPDSIFRVGFDTVSPKAKAAQVSTIDEGVTITHALQSNAPTDGERAKEKAVAMPLKKPDIANSRSNAQ